MIKDRSKWKIPLLPKVPPKENIWRDREGWSDKGVGAQRAQGGEAKAARADFGFSQWGGRPQKYGGWIQEWPRKTRSFIRQRSYWFKRKPNPIIRDHKRNFCEHDPLILFVEQLLNCKIVNIYYFDK